MNKSVKDWPISQFLATISAAYLRWWQKTRHLPCIHSVFIKKYIKIPKKEIFKHTVLSFKMCIVIRDCNPGIPDRFSIPKSRDYERPNPGISGWENNVLTLLLRVKCMHAKQLSSSETGQGIMKPGPSTLIVTNWAAEWSFTSLY